MRAEEVRFLPAVPPTGWAKITNHCVSGLQLLSIVFLVSVFVRMYVCVCVWVCINEVQREFVWVMANQNQLR